MEPYKSELLPHWRFRTPEVAHESAEEIYRRFMGYRGEGDFVGMDMARKFLQMGYTRARRYANHHSGRKYEEDGSGGVREQEPDATESKKAHGEQEGPGSADLLREVRPGPRRWVLRCLPQGVGAQGEGRGRPGTLASGLMHGDGTNRAMATGESPAPLLEKEWVKEGCGAGTVRDN